MLYQVFFLLNFEGNDLVLAGYGLASLLQALADDIGLRLMLHIDDRDLAGLRGNGRYWLARAALRTA